jgi:hypothetical protein
VREVKILEGVLTVEGGPLLCWRDRLACRTSCAAHALVAQAPDGRNAAFYCAALPQMIPLGVPEPSRIVVPSPNLATRG